MPIQGNLIRDQRLSNVSLKYTNSDFVGHLLFPVVNVTRDNDYYAKYGKESFNIVDTRIGRGNTFPETRWSASDAQYNCEKHGLKEFIDDDDLTASAGQGFKLMADTAELVMDQLLLARENRIASVVTDTSNFTNTATCAGSTQWDHASADPVEQVMSAMQKIKEDSATIANTLLLPWHVWLKTRENEQVKDRLSNDALTKVSMDNLKTLFEVPNILIGAAQYNSSDEPATPDIGNFVWGKHAFLAHVAPNPGVRRLSVGYNFVRHPARTLRWRAPEPDKLGSYVGTYFKEDTKLTEELCGYLFDNVIS